MKVKKENRAMVKPKHTNRNRNKKTDIKKTTKRLKGKNKKHRYKESDRDKCCQMIPKGREKLSKKRFFFFV